MKIIILLCMIFLHIVDDYYLQGILASMKQKSWWKNNSGYNPIYKNDYIVALLMHSFSWTFMVTLPIIITQYKYLNYVFIIAFIFNVFIHAYTDNEKANKYTINLVQDQAIHIIQILVLFNTFVLNGV